MPFDSQPVIPALDTPVLKTDAGSLLAKAKARIENPANWCKGGLTEGHRRCAVGAVLSVACTNAAYVRARVLLDEAVGPAWGFAALFNDVSTHAEVMDLFDRAIALAESEA